jgi:hypothetical protein
MNIIVRQISLLSFAALIVFSFSATSISLAQTPNGNSTQFAEQNVWPDNKMFSLLQDKFGRIWARTKNVLNWKDCSEFEQFYAKPNDSGAIIIVRSKLFDHGTALIQTKSFPENLNKNNSVKVLTQPNYYCLFGNTANNLMVNPEILTRPGTTLDLLLCLICDSKVADYSVCNITLPNSNNLS